MDKLRDDIVGICLKSDLTDSSGGHVGWIDSFATEILSLIYQHIPEDSEEVVVIDEDGNIVKVKPPEDKVKAVKEIRGEVELAVLQFANDYHRFERIRADVIFKGIKSHPKFIDEILSLIRQHIPEDKVKCHVQCSRCGNKVSNTVFSSLPEGLVVRAFVECAECIEKTPKLPEEQVKAVKEILKEIVGRVDNHTVFSDLYFKRSATQICQLFERPKVKLPKAREYNYIVDRCISVEGVFRAGEEYILQQVKEALEKEGVVIE